MDVGLKQLTRVHKSLVQQKVKLTNQLTTQLKGYYQIALQLFCKLDQEITLAFLERYPSPQKAKIASLEELWSFFRKEGYCRHDRIPFIYESLQKPSLTVPEELIGAYETVTLSLIPLLRCLLAQIEKLEDEILRMFLKSPAQKIFSSLPAGPIIAARLNAEIGSDSSYYPSKGYLQTDAGTAPVTKRSGKILIVHFRWQCNKHLRDAFQGLARESVKKCPWARQYLGSQLQAGHKPSRAYRALANRWAAIVWKMLKERECFNQSRLVKRQINILSTV